jgi:hypothetical protein
MRCVAALGIDMFGLDIVISGGRPCVVDINKFGSYMGVPDAPRLLANYLFAALNRAVSQPPVQLVASV